MAYSNNPNLPRARAIEMIDESSFGEITMMRFGGVITQGYSPKQQELIRQQLSISRSD
jgi:hypothetical protein